MFGDMVKAFGIIEPDRGVLAAAFQHDLLHISYGFLAHVDGPIGTPKYEQGEIDDGFEPLWKPIDVALQLTKDHFTLEPYQAPFIVKREIAFLEEAIKHLT